MTAYTRRCAAAWVACASAWASAVAAWMTESTLVALLVAALVASLTVMGIAAWAATAEVFDAPFEETT